MALFATCCCCPALTMEDRADDFPPPLDVVSGPTRGLCIFDCLISTRLISARFLLALFLVVPTFSILLLCRLSRKGFRSLRILCLEFVVGIDWWSMSSSLFLEIASRIGLLFRYWLSDGLESNCCRLSTDWCTLVALDSRSNWLNLDTDDSVSFFV